MTGLAIFVASVVRGGPGLSAAIVPRLVPHLSSPWDDDLEVIAMTAPAEQEPEWPDDEVPTEELARRAGGQPIASLEELHALAHPELWDSDEEYAEFLADLYASRRAYIG